MPTPYYHDSENCITLYCGECREIIPSLEGLVDVVLTDPPWELTGKPLNIRGAGVAPIKQANLTLRKGQVGAFDAQVVRDLSKTVAAYDCFFFCGYKELATVCLACDPLRGVFVWQKPNGAPSVAFPAKMDAAFIVWGGKCSLLYGHQHYPSMVFSVNVPNAGCMASERYVDATGKAFHPCQGPVVLYEQLLRPFPKEKCVLDPYADTGTTLRAAKNLGLRAIGVEREERYCELIVRRLEQNVFAFTE